VHKFVCVFLVAGSLSLFSFPRVDAAGQSRGTRKAAAEDHYQVPAGTALLLKMKTPIDSGKMAVDDQVEAELWSPIIQSGVELIPAGSVAIGKVTDVKRASERAPAGAVSFAFFIVEHAETGSRAMLTTRKVLVESPRHEEPEGSKKKVKAVQATMAPGASFVAMTAEPLVVRIPR
jgi:hypothetical protein